MSRVDLFLWVALPYLCLAVFVVGHVWRYRRDQLTWTARSTQLLEQPLLRVGSLLFHFGVLAVIWIIMSTNWCWFTCIFDSGLPNAMRCWQCSNVCCQRWRAVTGAVTTTTMRSS